MRVARATAILLLGALPAAGQVPAPTPMIPAAKTHLDAGMRLYQAAQYDQAILELAAGNALDPRPEFLYALGQAERRKGDCRAAVDYYRSFLKVATSAEQARAVGVQLERCEDELQAAREQAEKAKAPPVAGPLPDAAPSIPQAVENHPPGRALWPWIVGGGAAVVAAVVAVLAVSLSAVDYGARARAACADPGCVYFDGAH